MASIYNLFDIVHAGDSGGGYGDREVKLAAGPYVKYLKFVQKWHNNNAVLWKVVRPRGEGVAGRDARAGVDSGARRGSGAAEPTGKRRRGATPVSLEGLDDDKLQRIVDEVESSRCVYEYDRDTDRRAQRGDMIEVTKIDKEKHLLWLERPPGTPYLKAEHNTYQIGMMIKALEYIMYRPHQSHMPLRRLFRKNGSTAWPDLEEAQVDKWFFLNGNAEGVDGQRRFVKKALGTPDFAFLEGPPGSGKTTALCELVMQMASRGKRVLFCASTHVAVDNLLERLIAAGDEVSRHLVAIRVGTSDKVSPEASRYSHDRIVRTTKEKIQSNLEATSPRSRAQDMMLRVLGGRGGEDIGKMTRDHANLVCGTAIGIPSHPDIRSRSLRRFDMMILDEASKTTLQEFLVPAVHADRWIVVGDTRQLVPHVDQDDIALQVATCMREPLGGACLDAFMAKKRGQTTVVACPDSETERAYTGQCGKLGVRVRRPGDGGGPVGKGEVLLGPEKEVDKIALGRGITLKRRRVAGAGTEADAGGRGGPPGKGKDTWASAVAWRISIHWPCAAGGQNVGTRKQSDEVEMLMPLSDGNDDNDNDDVRNWIDRVKMIALPSVLELVQHGFRAGQEDGGTLLENGMPGDDFEKRHVLLEWQHRMHPDIADFPHRYMYEGRALKTPGGMDAKRAWPYRRYSSRAVWIDVHADKTASSGSPSNEGEADRIAREIGEFAKFAERNPRPCGGPWEVAVLSFYKGQLEPLRKRMRRVSPGGGPYTFPVPPGRPDVLVRINTVDSFQGHEADLVLLSTVNSHTTVFLCNPNRLNVALTRARYQCVVVGDRRAMSREDPFTSLANGIAHWTEAKQ